MASRSRYHRRARLSPWPCGELTCRKAGGPHAHEKTEAVRTALENELHRLDQAVPLQERLRPLQHRILSRPATGLEADKAFYDELSGDLRCSSMPPQ